MAKPKIYAGLEIGTTKICVVVGEAKPDGSIKILGVGQSPSRGVRKGEIVDFSIAQRCVHDALVQAEERSDVMIRNVILSITGAHIESFNNRGAISLPEEQEEISGHDLEEVRESARDISLPPEHIFIHSVIQHYYVDGQDKVLNPVGMFGRKLEADFHIIHGLRTRVNNAIRCVREIPLEVDDVVFSPIASAQVVLNKEHKELGALVIDIGGGTTDYILYAEGAVKESGVLPLGGDHITNDLSMVLKIPLSKAEKLKVEEGSAIVGNDLPDEVILLEDDAKFMAREIKRDLLNQIIHMRVRESFNLLHRKLQAGRYLPRVGAGVFLTGGGSQLHGIAAIAEETFTLPVHRVNAQSVSGHTATFENPQYTTPIGLIRYAQIAERERPSSSIARIGKRLAHLFTGGGSR